MAHGENAEKIGHAGREYWSRRPFSGMGWGLVCKFFTHRKERRQRKRDARAELERQRSGEAES